MNKQTVKAEMWDRMQFLFRNYYDRMIHVKLVYNGKFNRDILKNVVVYMVEKAPILHSSFNTAGIMEPYWKKEDYTVDDIVSFVESENADRDADEFLTGVIPYDNNVQMKISVFEQGDISILTIRVNHMCMDGGDLKYFVVTLCNNYNILANGGHLLSMKEGSRSYTEVYTKLEGEDLKTARGLYKNVSKSADKVNFPWTEDNSEDKNRIVKRVIPEEDFVKMKAISKKMGITVNDAIMALVFRSLYELCGLKDDDSITVSCAIDLRKHIQEGGAHSGLANHTAWMACRLTEKGETINDTIVNTIRSTKKYKRDKFNGLYSLPLLKLAYTLFPPDIAEFAIKIGYNNPLIAVSNIGLLDDKKLSFNDMKLVDGFMSGAVKYKPFFLMSLTTLLNRVTLSTAIRGNEKDEEVANRYFDLVIKNLAEFNKLG